MVPFERALVSSYRPSITTCPLSVLGRFGQGAVTLSGWEGNRRSGVALAMFTDFTGLSTYGLTA